MNWPIAKINDDLAFHSEPDGVWLRSQIGVLDVRQLRSHTSISRLGRLLPTLLPQLVELGLATLEKDGIRIEYGHFAQLEAQQGTDAVDSVVARAPFTTQIDTTGVRGTVYFRYYYRFYTRTDVVHRERTG